MKADFDHENYLLALIAFREKMRAKREVFMRSEFDSDDVIVCAIDTQINEINKEIESVNEWVEEHTVNHAMRMFIGEAPEPVLVSENDNEKDYYQGVPIYADLPTSQKFRLRKKDL